MYSMKTKDVKDEVLKPFGMKWNYEEQSWYKKVSQEIGDADTLPAFESALRDALALLGVQLRVSDPRAPSVDNTAAVPVPSAFSTSAPLAAPAPFSFGNSAAVPPSSAGKAPAVGVALEPVVHMLSQKDSSGVLNKLEVWGMKTIDIKDDVLKPFGMKWDPEGQRWNKKVSQSDAYAVSAFVIKLKRELERQGAKLRVEVDARSV